MKIFQRTTSSASCTSGKEERPVTWDGSPSPSGTFVTNEFKSDLANNSNQRNYRAFGTMVLLCSNWDYKPVPGKTILYRFVFRLENNNMLYSVTCRLKSINIVNWPFELE